MKYSLLLILLLCSIPAFSQKIDTSIFKSSYEKKIFVEFQNTKKIKYIELLLALNYSNSSQNIEENIISFCKKLEQTINKSNKKKQIKEIYNQVHNCYFKKYQEDAYFNDIFLNGNYNCVTASALYCIVLDYFKIDYNIKETPNHVYLIADPSSTSFLIETTLPSNGVFVFDEGYKKTYVDYLHNNKIISESEYSSSSIDDLFKKHYESDKTIDPVKLAALQYFNKGVFEYNKNDYLNASADLEKAVIVYPSDNIKFLYSNALKSLIVDQTGSKKYNGKTLAKYLNANMSDPEAIQTTSNHFSAVSREMVINRPNIQLYTSFYNDFISSLNDSIDKKDYIQNYHEILAYYYYLKTDYKKVLDYAAKSYEVNPENLQTQQLVLESLMKYFQNLDEEGMNGEAVAFDTIMNIVDNFPFLINNQLILKFIAFGFVEDFNEVSLQPSDSKEKIKRLQSYCQKLLKNKIPENKIESIYIEAVESFTGYKTYDKSEVILKSGLEILPQSTVLKEKLARVLVLKKNQNNSIRNSSVVVSSYQLIKPPAYNDTEVYNSVKKHLLKCWKIALLKKDGTKEENEELTFTFQPEGKVKVQGGGEEDWGTWNLSTSGPILTLKSPKEELQFSILIYECNASIMRGIASPYKTENVRIEFSACGN